MNFNVCVCDEARKWTIKGAENEPDVWKKKIRESNGIQMTQNQKL